MRTADLVHFCPPARLIIGSGSRKQLPALVQRLGWKRGLLVTDTFFTKNTPWVTEYVEAAQLLGITTHVFDGGLPDPTTTLCDEATAALRSVLGPHLPDHVVALGGGSNIDLAKALCLTLTSGKPVLSFVGDIGAQRPLPLIAVPTTAGTGSEATPGAILLDPLNSTKVAVMDNALRPQVALIDPEFTYTCPPRVTADAGIDALTHAMESFMTLDSAQFDRGGQSDPGYSGRSALTMVWAREAMKLCFQFLERCYRDGSDVEARAGMAYASVYAALSYGSAGLNAVHGIAYAVAGETHKTHGSTNAVMLAYVLDALRDCRRAELLEVASMMGIAAEDEELAIDAVPVAIRDLIGRLGIPTNLKDFGIEADRLGHLVSDALSVERLAKAFPVANVPASYAQICTNAYNGSLRGSQRG